MATTGHENEAIKVSGFKANERKLVNLLPYNEGTCSTAADTAAKEITISGNSFSLVNKAKVIVTFTNGISVDNATLSVNSGAAKAIYYKGSALKGGTVAAGSKIILEYNGTQWDVLGELFNEDGEYMDLVAGNIVGEFTQEANVSFRPSAGSTDIKTGYQASKGGHLEGIKGNTVAWNQVANQFYAALQNDLGNAGLTVTVQSNGDFIINGSVSTARALNLSDNIIPFVDGHKYYSTNTVKTGVHVFYGGMQVGSGVRHIGTSNGTPGRLGLYISANTQFQNYLLKLPQLADLTLIYGSGNEPSTAAEFEADYQRWFGKPLSYEAYDAGSLRPVKMTGLKTTGFNAWDEEWENGAVSIDGSLIEDQTRIRPKNFIEVLPNTTYCLSVKSKPSGTTYVMFYSNNESASIIGYASLSSSRTFTTPSNCRYIKFSFETNVYGNTYLHDINLNLHHSGAKDGEYEPHWESTLNVPVTTITGKLNGEGNSVVVFPDAMKKTGNVYDEIVQRGNQVIGIKRIGKVDMGTLDWVYSPVSAGFPNGFFCSSISGFTRKGTAIQIACANYECGISGWTKDKLVRTGDANTDKIYVIDSSYTDITTFKTAMNGVILYYELAEPQEYVLDFDLPQDYDVDDYGTEEVQLGTNGIAPVLDIKYGINAPDTIKNLPHSYVSAVGEQNFTDAQKLRARKNIGVEYICPNGVCSTAATTVAKVATIPHFIPFYGNMVSIRFASAISVANATLNISSTGAYPIYYNGAALQPGLVRAGLTLLMQFDGSRYNILSIMGLDKSGAETDLWVDMGLPSGTLWAKKNIDVTQDNGFCASEYQYECSFFSWGNVDGHNPTSTTAFDYNWGTAVDGAPYKDTEGAKLTGNIAPSFDAARVNLGSPWRMPTSDDFGELFNSSYTKFIDANGDDISSSTANKLITMNGVTGIRIKSKINGNIIFFPCSGFGSGTSLNYSGSRGYYSSSSLHSAAKEKTLFFYSNGISTYSGDPLFYGFSIRPVM